MLVTESGMLTDARLLQYRKAELPMLETESGMLTDARLLQDRKAALPMLVTEPGMLWLGHEHWECRFPVL